MNKDDEQTTTKPTVIHNKTEYNPPATTTSTEIPYLENKVTLTKRISQKGRLTISDAWATIKRHANSDLKKRYRELMTELLK